MPSFAIITDESEEVTNLVSKLDRNLRSNALTKSFINGFAEPVKDDMGYFIFISADPLLLFNPFWYGVIFTIGLYLLIGSSYWLILTSVPSIISFAWSEYFYYLLIKRSFRKKKQPSKLMDKEELIKRLFLWGNQK